MRSPIAKVVVALFALAVPVVAVAAAVPAQADDAPGQFVMMVNNLRAQDRVAPLATDPVMTSVAQQWANNLASNGVLVHNPNEGTQVTPGWTKLGENIADGHSLAAVFAALENSPSHLANMVDPAFNRTGVGVATDSNGQLWVVEDLGQYPPPANPVIVFPTSGSRISPMAQSFTWQQVMGASIYSLTVGSTEGALDMFNSGELPGTQLSVTVPALPAGDTLWARVYSFVGGTWTWSDVQFSVT